MIKSIYQQYVMIKQERNSIDNDNKNIFSIRYNNFQNTKSHQQWNEYNAQNNTLQIRYKRDQSINFES